MEKEMEQEEEETLERIFVAGDEFEESDVSDMEVIKMEMHKRRATNLDVYNFQEIGETQEEEEEMEDVAANKKQKLNQRRREKVEVEYEIETEPAHRSFTS